MFDDRKRAGLGAEAEDAFSMAGISQGELYKRGEQLQTKKQSGRLFFTLGDDKQRYSR